MMKSFPAAVILLMLFSSPALAQSVLRVQCTDDNEGAEIFINGEFKGSCPADLFLPAGEKNLRAVKPVGEEQERVFETRFMLRSDSARRIKVELAEPQLTAEAKRKRKEARLAREREAVESARRKAEQDDIAAMRELARYYREGKGVPENPEKAEEWQSAARALEEKRASQKLLEQARNGDSEAMTQIAERYESGLGIEQDSAKAEKWHERARQAKAEIVRGNAREGDVGAMRTLAGYYDEGWGVEKSPEKAEKWTLRAEEGEERARKIAEAKARDARLQRKIDNTKYLAHQEAMFDVLGAFDSYGMPESSVMASILPAMILGLAVDASSSPIKSTQVAFWKSQMSSRAARFENPDSMIARAYADQHSLEKK